MLIVSTPIRQQLLAHAHAAVPTEACGVLGGERIGEKTHILTARQADNVAEHPDHRYRIDPEALYRHIEAVTTAGQELVGFYHTHPDGPPRPSRTDRELAQWPGYLYVIVVPGGEPAITAWEWDGKTFTRCRVRRG